MRVTTDADPPATPQPTDGTSPSLAERAYLALRDAVVTLRLPPASPLREDRLREQLGFGRTPIREAIKRMEVEGLVAVYPRRGTFVTDVNISDHRLIADVRGQLEAHAAERAAAEAGDAERDRLRELRELTTTPDESPSLLVDADTTIHRAIYACTHNRYLEATLNQYYNLALRIWHLFLQRLPDMGEHVAEHAALLDAIIAGEQARAGALAARHVGDFDRAIKSVI